MTEAVRVRLEPALVFLATRDSDLARVLDTFGPPPLWRREPGFATLLHIILEQQVSLLSAKRAFDRLVAVAGPPTPEGVLRLSGAELRAIGFSRQKAAYARALAEAVGTGTLELGTLETLDDDAVRAALTRVKGVGPWTADIYLLMALGRPDAWPGGDLALAVAAQEVKGLPARPSPAALAQLAERWRPQRAAAARLLWHYYLSRRKTS